MSEGDNKIGSLIALVMISLKSGLFFLLRELQKASSSEIWSDRLKPLYNRHTESRRERR